MDYRDIIERAVWTALQSFLAVFSITDLATLEAASVAGMGALISALKTVASTKLASSK
jgi:hypothetical protein|tara:strand:- start:908 stop:1081 length:174 start_codon:yes stop_codon:yes gene_type:complete